MRFSHRMACKLFLLEITKWYIYYPDNWTIIPYEDISKNSNKFLLLYKPYIRWTSFSQKKNYWGRSHHKILYNVKIRRCLRVGNFGITLFFFLCNIHDPCFFLVIFYYASCLNSLIHNFCLSYQCYQFLYSQIKKINFENKCLMRCTVVRSCYTFDTNF